ncbi:MAG: nitroreductase [Methylococcaceae bacterium]|nr:nitroreductase [Methylococcaceae bacterium]
MSHTTIVIYAGYGNDKIHIETMKVTEALKQRKSVRAFLNKEVNKKIINSILEAASHAPSGVNTQPWQVAVVTGDKKQALQEQIENAFRSGDKGKADYPYYPEKWQEPYKSRRKACGLQLYSALGIARGDKQLQLDQWAANYRAFGAPVMLLFFLDSVMKTGSFLDYGMFLQSVMLSAVEHGLASCPLASLSNYPHIIKPALAYPNDSLLVCGMALGYEDKEAIVNSYRTPRVTTFS